MTINENAPKPKPPVKKIAAVKQVKKPAPKQEKKAYIRPEHLTDRPFSDAALFEKLRQGASEASTGMKNPRRVKKENSK